MQGRHSKDRTQDRAWSHPVRPKAPGNLPALLCHLVPRSRPELIPTRLPRALSAHSPSPQTLRSILFRTEWTEKRHLQKRTAKIAIEISYRRSTGAYATSLHTTQLSTRHSCGSSYPHKRRLYSAYSNPINIPSNTRSQQSFPFCQSGVRGDTPNQQNRTRRKGRHCPARDAENRDRPDTMPQRGWFCVTGCHCHILAWRTSKPEFVWQYSFELPCVTHNVHSSFTEILKQ